MPYMDASMLAVGLQCAYILIFFSSVLWHVVAATIAHAMDSKYRQICVSYPIA